MDAVSSPTMMIPASIVCLFVVLPKGQVAEDPVTILDACKDTVPASRCSIVIKNPKYCKNSDLVNKCRKSCGMCGPVTHLPTCKDDIDAGLCATAITDPRYCSASNMVNMCRKSCGLCDSTTVTGGGPHTCRDEVLGAICGEAIKKESYCNQSNRNNKCKQSCGLCGGESTSAPCRDEVGPDECMDIITANGSYCNSTNKNNQCRMSCGLCGGKSTSAPCRDEVGPDECMAIITANGSYCNSTNKNNQCRMSCGLCGGESTSAPCRDEVGPDECMAIITANGSYCNSTNKNNQCRMSCGLCGGENTSAPCRDEVGPDECMAIITANGSYCNSTNRNNRCRMSCGLCGGESTSAPCRDEVGPDECMAIITANGSYCNSTNRNNQCRMSCGLCGGESTSAPCRDEVGPDECMAIITANGSYCNSTNRNNQCRMSCGLCEIHSDTSVEPATCKDDLKECADIIKNNGSYCDPINGNNHCKLTCGLCRGESTSAPCRDDVGPDECMAIITANESYCNSTNRNNQCRMSCGLCGGESTSAPCRDEVGPDECMAIITANGSYCNSTNRNNQCRMSCGLCDAACSDSLPLNLCSELVKKDKYCSLQTGCRMSCGLCKTDSMTGMLTYPAGNMTTDGYVSPFPTPLNQTSDNATTENQTPDTVTAQNETSDNVITHSHTSIDVTSQSQTWDNVTTAAEIYSSITIPISTMETSTIDPSSQGDSSSEHAKETRSRYNESRPESNESVRLNQAKGNLALGKPSRLSSTVAGGEASKANDGNNGTDGTDCSHTDPNQSSPWWRVDLQGVFTITSVVIFNRHDCCCGKLTGVTIDVDSKDRDVPEEGDDSTRNCDVVFRPFSCGEKRVLRCGFNTWGRYVWIKQPIPGLTLCEVEIYGKLVTGTECPVLKNSNFPSKNFLPTFSTQTRSVGTSVKVGDCGSGRTLMGAKHLKCLPNLQWDNPVPICIENIKTNLAYMKKASQSSTLEPARAKHAVDGEIGLNGRSCSTTAPSDTTPRWTIDLGGRFSVASVIVVNRRDCCCHYLFNFTIAVEEAGRPPVVCATNISEFACGEMRYFSCPLHTRGSRVYIEKSSPTLTLCEVVIQGKEVRAKECPPLKPSAVEKGFPPVMFSSRQRRPGSKVTVKCPAGSIITGYSTLKCLSSGHWDNSVPLCIDLKSDVAAWKPSVLSSTLGNNDARLAVDARFPGVGTSSRCARSQPTEERPWWSVDLRAVHNISAVVVVNDKETCQGHFSIRVINTDQKTRAKTKRYCVKNVEVKGCGGTEHFRCSEGIMGREVVIEKLSPTLVLCEVVVIGTKDKAECPKLRGTQYVLSSFDNEEGTDVTINECTNGLEVAGAKRLKCLPSGKWNKPLPICLDTRGNLAINKQAYLSSAQQLHRGSASKANDGVFDHSFVGSACSMSHQHDSNPWWQVDLQDIYMIETVTITNRHDARCKRMNGVLVFVYGEDVTPRNPRSKGTVCSLRQMFILCGKSAIIKCKPDVVGRHVRVTKHGNLLSLCEVVVKGRKQARKACPPLEDPRLPPGLFNKFNLNRLRVGDTSRSVGTRLRVGCYNNYRPIGHTSLECQKNGKWNRRPATCRAPKKLPWHCPVDEGYFYLLEEDFCFKLDTRQTSWFEAVKACAAMPGGVLAELNTPKKQQAVYEAVQSKEDYRSTDYYIGGSRFVEPGNWTWLSKVPVNPHVSPQTSRKGERCLSMSSVHGRYMGLKCLTKQGRVCEKRPSVKDAKQCIDSHQPMTCYTKAIEGLCESKKSDAKRTMKYKCKRTCDFCTIRDIRRGRCKDSLRYDTCEDIKKKKLCLNPTKRQQCLKTCGKCQEATTPSTTTSHYLQPGAKCGMNSSLMSGTVNLTDAQDNLPPCVYTISGSSRNQTRAFVLEIYRFPSPDTLLVTPPPPFDASYSLPNTDHADIYSFTGINFTLNLNSSSTRTGTRFQLTWESTSSGETGAADDMLSVFCNTSGMSVKYKVAGTWQATLADPTCSLGVVNNTYVITAAFDTCSTTRTETKTRTTFVNQLLFRSLDSGVTREWSRPVTCTFPRSPLVYRSTGVLSTGHPLLGNTTVWMDIYKGSERMSVFPVTVDYSTTFTILFTTSGPSVAPQLQPHDCFMAPSKAPHRNRFPLITNTCPHGTVNMTRTRRGIYMFVTSRHTLTSATKAHIFCTVGRCNSPSCRPCKPQHSLPLSHLLEIQQGPFVLTPSTGLKPLSSISQSTPHSGMSGGSNVSSSSLSDTELRTGVTEGTPVSTGESPSGHHLRPTNENRNADDEAKGSPLGVTLKPNRTPPHSSWSSGSSGIPSHPSESSEVPMEIPLPESESGVLEMPSQNATFSVSGTLSTGTAVGVGVGVVMVSVMAITLAMIKYGPGVKIFKRGSGRNQ